MLQKAHMANDKQDDLYIKQVKIQNRWISGFYQTIRAYTIWITLVGFFVTPWLQWNHRQAILLDVSARRFYIFAFTFWPQDFYLLLLLVISAALSLIVVTNLAGRIWCGYTCPQTVWTKCYMWLEYMIEGDRNKRLKRDKNPWETATMIRRVIKHILWLLLALATAVTFVGYFAPIRDIVILNVTSWIVFWIVFFTFATYLNAGWMREQVCLYICPYARFQSVMFDRNTLVITYDHHRGEPRGSRKHNSDKKNLGDCIDCQLCVQVCPTGIDIRDGLQMACIGCAACVDACNSIMDKMHYPRGLVRYHTENALDGRKTKFIRPRLMASCLLLVVVIAVFGLLLFNRIPMQFEIIHDHRNLYRVTANNTIENSYLLSISNMTQNQESYKITMQGATQLQYVGPDEISLAPNTSQVIPVTLTAPIDVMADFSTPIIFTIESIIHPALKMRGKSNFFSPKG